MGGLLGGGGGGGGGTKGYVAPPPPLNFFLGGGGQPPPPLPTPMSCTSVRRVRKETSLGNVAMPLAHSYLETRKRLIGKHCRPRSDAT